MLEVGGRSRLGDPLRRICNYSNADRYETDALVDIPFDEAGKLLASDRCFDFSLASFVFCEIADRSVRLGLLSELRRVTKEDGVLLLLDDLDLHSPRTITLPSGDFFHSTRLGVGFVDEIRSAGWTYVQIATLRHTVDDLSNDFPAIVGSRAADFQCQAVLGATFYLSEAPHPNIVQ